MRVVITGGPSVGKTTVIKMIAERGFRVVQEIATALIKEGRYLPWENRARFQSEVLRRQLNAEASILEFDQPVFLDRGAFDGEAYYIHDGLPVPPSFSTIDPSQYDIAFLMEPLAFFDSNDVRRENLDFTLAISEVLSQCYSRRGIRVVRVPALDPQSRVDFVLEEVESLRKSRVRSPEQAAALFHALGHSGQARGAYLPVSTMSPGVVL